MKYRRQLFNSGFSLVEMMVVVLVFSILAVIATQSLALSLRGTRKSEAVARVRENVDYSLSIMQRLLRNAKSIDSCTNNRVDFIDAYGALTSFYCEPAGGTNGYIASGSSTIRLTSPAIYIDCSGSVFNCPPPTLPAPPTVEITLKASDAKTSGAESAQVTVSSRVLLRAY